MKFVVWSGEVAGFPAFERSCAQRQIQKDKVHLVMTAEVRNQCSGN